MTVPVIAFFNNMGGVGKTSLVYHLSWMYSDMGYSVLAADLDPQANLTSAFLDEDRLEELWNDEENGNSIFDSLQPLIDGTGDIANSHVEEIDDALGLLVGDLRLSGFEDELAANWPMCLDENERAFRVVSAFWRLMQQAAEECEADMILVDLGPSLGAINRAALIASDYIVVPLSPDLFSVQGLKNLGPTLNKWRKEWRDRLDRNPFDDIVLPKGNMMPIGYVIMQHSVRLDRPVKAYEKWIQRIPGVYRKDVIGKQINKKGVDSNRLAQLKNYRSLISLSQEARKPLFLLQVADGAIGANVKAVKDAYTDFKKLAEKILEAASI